MTVLNSQPHFLLIPAPLAIFAILFWPYYVPRQTPANREPGLRVMTYNILYSNTDAAAVAQVIRTYHPDLVALQEVQLAMMSALQQQIADEYPHSHLGAAHPFGTTAIFSRQPFLRVDVVNLGMDRPAAVARVQIKGQAITFVAAHLQAYGWQWVPLCPITRLYRAAYPRAKPAETDSLGRSIDRRSKGGYHSWL